MDFQELGVSQGSFVDISMRLYKSPEVPDVISNWVHLVKDPHKGFQEKCRDVFHILTHLQNRLNDSLQLCSKSIHQISLLPSDDLSFCVAQHLCLSNRAPIFGGRFHRMNSLLTSDDKTRSFLEKCGVAKTFKPDIYVEMINGLKTAQNHEQLRNIRDILEFIRKHNLKVANLPDRDMNFTLINELCLDDYNLRYALTDRQLAYCHPDITHDLAIYFGVQTKRSMIETMNRDVTFEPFVQIENLCGRLKRIAESYSNPLDVFKELIQNADDAGAKTIHFILDQRSAPQSPKVVNVGYEKLLEPALLVFNDSYFTSEDIQGLKNLGKGSKSSNVNKIGKFGVGFNCVYCLSDYPCFMTQVDAQGEGNFCLLDPSRQISEIYGQKININSDLLQNYPDTFGCFLCERPELNAVLGNTMFRFPLRSKPSELGEKTLPPNDLLETLKMLSSSLQQCLLFLRSVNIVTISEIDDSGCLREIKSVSKSVTQVSETNYSTMSSVNATDCKLLSVKMMESGGRVLSNWLLSCQDGSTVPILPRMSSRRVNLAASVAYPLKIAAQQEKDQTIITPGIWCFLPLEEVSAQMRNEHSHPKLPVAVNASFILDESRKILSLESHEDKGVWNSHLLLYSVAKAYAELIMHLVRGWTSNPGLYSIKTFLKHLPLSELEMRTQYSSSNSLNSLIAQGLLNNLRKEAWIPQMSSDKSLKDFRRIDDIRNLTSCYGLSREHFSAVYKISEDLGFFITQLPSDYLNCLQTFSCPIGTLQPLEVLDNLSDIQFRRTQIENSVFKSLENLTCFLDWSKNELPNYSNIDSLPIFLTADGYLQRNNENRLYSSAFSIAQIFPALKDRIIHHEVNARLPPLTATLTVAEFFELMREHFPDLCNNKPFIVEERKRTDTLHWVELIWEFLYAHRSIICQFWDNFHKLSILMTQNRSKHAYLNPVSTRKERVFETLPRIRIGPVELNLVNYEFFYQLVPEMSATCRDIISPYLLSRELSVSQQINILYIITTENGDLEIHEDERLMLYRYFKDIFTNDSEQFSDVDFVRLQEIPIFLTITGQIECLSDVEAVFSIPNNVPQIGFNVITVQTEKYVMQESAGKGTEFQQKLGIIAKTVTQIYAEAIIFKHFEKFNFQAVKKHLKFLAKFLEMKPNGVCENVEASAVIFPILKACKFLEKGNDADKRKPSDLFDFKNFVFQIFRSEKLIDLKYAAHLPLLRLCGLNHKLSAGEFKGMIADHTANIYGNGYPDNAEILRVFGELMNEFGRLNLGVNDFREVGSLAMFETLDHEFHKLSDVYLFQHKVLVEHVANVLSSEYSSKLTEFVGDFPHSYLDLWRQASPYAQMKPSPSLVLDNLIHLVDIQNSDYQIRKCIEYIVREATCPENRAIITRLSSIACVQRSNGTTKLLPRNVCKTFNCDLLCGSECMLHFYVGEPVDDFLAMWQCLEKLGASNLPTLQQKVYALADFYSEVSQGEIWTRNPNVREKFESLQRHIWYHTDPKEFSQLSSHCPIYLLCEDGVLRDIHDCVLVDNMELYRTVCERENNSQNCQQNGGLEKVSTSFPPDDWNVLLTPKENIGPMVQLPGLMAQLPPEIRPKFFTKICHVSLDHRTLCSSNSTQNQFDLEQFEQKKCRPDFYSRLAHVIDSQDRLNGYEMPSFSTIKSDFPKILISVQNCFGNVHLKPVKSVDFTYTFKGNGFRIENTFKRDFYYCADEHTIIFTYPFVNISRRDDNSDLHRITSCMFIRHKTRLDSKAIQILAELIFTCKTISDENQVLDSHGISSAIELEPVDSLIGRIVPTKCYAIIDRDPYRQFKEKELVAVTHSEIKEDEKQIYLYGKIIEPEPNDANVNSFSMVKLQTNSRLSAELVSKNKVFGFLEKLPDVETSNAVRYSVERAEEEFQRDVEKLNQIIWTAALARGSSFNMNSDLQDLERRIVAGIVQKYLDPELQKRMINSVGDAIRTQIEAERASSDQEMISSNDSNKFDTIPQRVGEFLLFHCQRMQEEIAAHREQVQTAIRTSGTMCDSVVNFHFDVLHSAQPHPVLARLWLCQAKEHLASLERFESGTAEGITGQDWRTHILGKV